jgi:hypothetical protein
MKSKSVDSDKLESDTMGEAMLGSRFSGMHSSRTTTQYFLGRN